MAYLLNKSYQNSNYAMSQQQQPQSQGAAAQGTAPAPGDQGRAQQKGQQRYADFQKEWLKI